MEAQLIECLALIARVGMDQLLFAPCFIAGMRFIRTTHWNSNVTLISCI